MQSLWMRNTILASAAMLPWILAAGCAAPIYDRGQTAPAAKVTANNTWRVAGNLKSPSLAIDGNVNTAAFGEAGLTNPEIDIDLGKACVFNTVIIDHGGMEMAFPQNVTIEVRPADDKPYQRVAVAAGKRRVTSVTWVTPVLGRYIRIKATGVSSAGWSVAEIYVR